MTAAVTPRSAALHTLARAAGFVYLAVIMLGLGAEGLLRAPLSNVMPDAAGIATLHAQAGRLPLGIAADLLMLLCDVALAVLLYRLLQPAGPGLALAAMAFRLLQAAVLAGNLLNLQLAWLLLSGTADPAALPADQAGALAAVFVDLHRHGYDLGLAFFGVASLLTARLLQRSAWVPPAIGIAVAAAGLVYLAGSVLRLLAPAWHEAFAVAYLIPIAAESALCLALIRARPQPLRAPHRRSNR